MNKKYLIILIVLMIFSVGCENKKSSALKNGQTALESHEYVKAQKYLSEALEQDSKNETARAMYMQAIKMPEAEYYKEKGLYNIRSSGSYDDICYNDGYRDADISYSDKSAQK